MTSATTESRQTARNVDVQTQSTATAATAARTKTVRIMIRTFTMMMRRIGINRPTDGNRPVGD